MIGTGWRGLGSTATSSSAKNLPLMLTCSPASRGRRIAQRLVHTPTSGGGVDAAGQHLSAVLSADAAAEYEPSRRELSQRGDLTGNDHRMTQGQQIDAGVDLELRRGDRECGRLQQARQSLRRRGK